MPEDGSPLVSIIVLYYKRRETIEETLDSIRRQDYPNREVIVVDNHSEDGLRELIQDRFAECRFLELPQNIGACGGRNEGIRAAKGEFLIFLEDDVSFLSPFEISRMMKVWEAHPDVHVLALKVCDPDTGTLRLREWCHPRYWKEFSDSEFETYWFGEGASAFRRGVFERCGSYYEPLFYGAEGDDLVVRLFNQGFRILYTPQVRVGHRASEKGRSFERQYYYFTRNYFWMAYKDFPVLAGIRYLLPKLLMMFYFTLRTGSYGPFFRGVRDGIRGLKVVGKDRTPANAQAMRRLAQLEKWKPNLLVRLARHREAPQI